jgi:hypothetical protein
MIEQGRSCGSVTGAGLRDGNPRGISEREGPGTTRGQRAVSLPDREHRPKKSTLAHPKMGWTVFAP